MGVARALGRDDATHPFADGRRVSRLVALIVAGWFPVLGDRAAVTSVADLFPLANAAHPYFIPDHAWLLYVWSPLVVASSCLLVLSPGLLLALALDEAESVERWLLSGFVLSLVVVSLGTTLLQSLTGRPLTGGAFAASVAGYALASGGYLIVRLAGGRPPRWPLARPHAGTTVLSVLAVPLLLLVTLTPKFYWENFNGDGAHAFESARLLLVQPVPFWHSSGGTLASFPGITTMLFTFPASWFIRLFGEIEASARLPLLMYLVPLYAAVLALAEHAAKTNLRLAERSLLWLTLVVYVVVQAFSNTYNPYSADIALPGAQDTLLMVGFFGFVLAFLRQEPRWIWAFVGISFTSSPGGILLLGAWLTAVALLWTPRPRREITRTATAVLGCLAIAAVVPRVLVALHLPPPGSEHGLTGLLRKLAFLQWADWRRVLFVIVPCGFLPALALAAWRRQDHVSRALTVATIIYFAFFYVQAYTVLHYFVPAMLLPIVVFWRSYLAAELRQRGPVLACTGTAIFLALLLSLPRSTSLDTSARLVGSTMDDRTAGYEAVAPTAFRRFDMLHHLFPFDWEPVVPEMYGGSPLSWAYYAHHSGAGSAGRNYVIQLAADPPPPGMRVVAREADAALYVRSEPVWAAHRAMRPPTPAGSKIYFIPRGLLFRSVRLTDGPAIINVVDVLERMGIPVFRILDWLGVKH